MKIMVFCAMFLLLSYSNIFSVVFTFETGSNNYLTQTTAEWIENGVTLSFSVTGAGTANPLGEGDGILGTWMTGNSWVVSNGNTSPPPIVITVSITGKVFDLAGFNILDWASEGGATYSLETSSGGSKSGNVAQDSGSDITCSGGGFSGISSFTITFTSGSTAIACLSLDNLELNNINNALPVQLLSFTSSITEDLVNLNWTTATEVNNYGFEVERSSYSAASSQGSGNDRLSANTNTKIWEKIGFVKGSGSSNISRKYSFDDSPLKGRKYSYRLKQIDNNGEYEYSPEIEVLYSMPDEFIVSQNYPNPFNPLTRINFTIPSDRYVEIRIFNALGVETSALLNEYKQAGTHSIEFDGSSYASGIYFYKITAGNFTEIKKMILLK